ncbi:MAG: hypothetical protein A2086_00795 [Spirochaetes bacterium GWD1_27_9]|nr:MAG: hypothetical protein A2Y34_02775 [Spirochaetes bacterium GWC1_27_15]OHD32547.1 MAG: hypothetical protein A2086_00795 [Spirochaetes bacterium GWD1_27_9]
MNTIKSKLLQLEDNFILFKAKFEKRHLLFVALYFLPPALATFLLSRYFKELYDKFFVRVIIFSVIIIGVIIHFVLKYTYYKTNKKYKEFVENGLKDIKDSFGNEEDFRKAIVDATKEIYTDKNSSLSNLTVKNSLFWTNVFIVIGIEIEE